jgi:hypothetical protein
MVYCCEIPRKPPQLELPPWDQTLNFTGTSAEVSLRLVKSSFFETLPSSSSISFGIRQKLGALYSC